MATRVRTCPHGGCYNEISPSTKTRIGMWSSMPTSSSLLPSFRKNTCSTGPCQPCARMHAAHAGVVGDSGCGGTHEMQGCCAKGTCAHA
jgi:hypothetical protein